MLGTLAAVKSSPVHLGVAGRGAVASRLSAIGSKSPTYEPQRSRLAGPRACAQPAKSPLTLHPVEGEDDDAEHQLVGDPGQQELGALVVFAGGGRGVGGGERGRPQSQLVGVCRAAAILLSLARQATKQLNRLRGGVAGTRRRRVWLAHREHGLEAPPRRVDRRPLHSQVLGIRLICGEGPSRAVSIYQMG